MKSILKNASIILFGIILIFFLDQIRIRRLNQSNLLTLEKEASLLEHELKNALQSRTDIIKYISSMISFYPELNETAFKNLAASIMEYSPPLRALQLTDNNTRVIYVYPPVGNEITITKPMVLKDDPLRGKFVKDAIAGRKMTLQPPFELRQGGLGMVARNPVFSGDEFRCLVIGVFDAGMIFNEAFHSVNGSMYDIALIDESGNMLYQAGGVISGETSAAVSIMDLSWTLKVGYASESLTRQRSDRIIVLISGIFFIVSLLLVLRAAELRNRNLAAEVERQTADLRASEDRLKKSLAEKNTLLKELYHRTKNNMQVISSMLSLQANSMHTPEVDRLVDTTDRRLQAMALVHQKLYQSHDLDRIRLDEYIRDLSVLIRTGHHSSDGKIEFDFRLDPVVADIESAIPLGLMLNELITNSFKHAFPGNMKGKITIILSENEKHMCELNYADNGIGIRNPVPLDASATLGLKTISVIAEEQLEGHLSINTENGFHLVFSWKNEDSME